MKLSRKLCFSLLLISVLLLFACFILHFLHDVSKLGINLSYSEKIEDFEYFYQTIISSIPMINNYKEIYGFSFADRKEYYKELVASTQNDYEFFCVMSAISQDIPSFHTDLVEPFVDSYKGLHCFNSFWVNMNPFVTSACKNWENAVLNQTEAVRNANFYCFLYMDGVYIYDGENDSNIALREGARLLSVNDIAVDDFIKDQIMIYNLYYDGQYGKPCRTKIVFNVDEGVPVSLSVIDEDGEIVSVDAFYSLYMEAAYCFMNTTTTEDYQIYRDSGFTYIFLNSFLDQFGAEVKSTLEKDSNNCIILDLRQCYGGNQDFAVKYLYPVLFNESHKVSKTWFIPKSSENKKVYLDPYNRIIYHFRRSSSSPYSSQGAYLASTTSQEYIGGDFERKNVIVLTSQKTGSAADEFVSVVKRYNLATVIGNNTGGEGLAGSYMVTTCPNSHLAFVYMPGGGKNPDGTDNSVYGTAPDVYISQSVEDWARSKEQSVGTDEISANDSIENLIEYDTVLRLAVNYFNKILYD